MEWAPASAGLVQRIVGQYYLLFLLSKTKLCPASERPGNDWAPSPRFSLLLVVTAHLNLPVRCFQWNDSIHILRRMEALLCLLPTESELFRCVGSVSR